MTFQEQLNLYIEELSCSGRELAQNSGISETILSRYRKGERLPGADSDYLKKLAAGIALTAEQKGKKKDRESVLEVLLAALKQEEKSEIFYYQKFDILLRELEINVSKMASALHYDPSYISKIRTGKRTPSDAHKNYQFSLTKVKGFHNIQITCRMEKWCMVSKNKTPSIHFVIHHPKLRYALENMILPIRDS